jgi:hypothetical protein
MTRVDICIRCAKERERRFYEDWSSKSKSVADVLFNAASGALAKIIRKYGGKGCPFYSPVRVKAKCPYALERLMADDQ